MTETNPPPAAETLREDLTDRFWLIVREPGRVPERKGPWKHSETAKVLREFMAANPTAFIDHLTIGDDGTPDVEHGPLVLQYTDGRSMAVGRKHNERTRAAANAALAAPDDITCAGAEGRANARDDIALADKIATAAGYTGKNPTLSNCAMGTALTAIEMLLPARPEPVVDGEPSFVPGAVWKEAEDDCWTSEVQVVGGHEIVATVHGATEAQAMVRRDLVVQALSREPVVDGAAEVLSWFSGQHRLSLDHYSPVYGDDEDQSVEWRVTRESGSINDREFDVIGRGETAFEAMVAARATLCPDHVGQPGTGGPPANSSTDSAVRAKALEDAAKVADQWNTPEGRFLPRMFDVPEDELRGAEQAAAGIAAAIRALLPTEAR